MSDRETNRFKFLNNTGRFQHAYMWGGLLLTLWTLIIAISLTWNHWHHQWGLEKTLQNVAKSHFEKDVLYRRWNAMHGGVYVPLSEHATPNSYLSNDERDITTLSGRKLTLINPAYMTRQVHKLAKQELNIQGHITSLNPIRPQNMPYPWEAEALREFERGESQYNSIRVIDGTERLLFMKPLITEQGCLKCHAHQGYQLGAIRGGISVSVPTQPFRENSRGLLQAIYLSHGVVWLLGSIGIFVSVAALNKARLNAEEATAAKSEFLANMSHEIRTPMNAVLGFTEILKGSEFDPQKKSYINAIHSAGHALLSMINDVLDLSKIESGKVEFSYSAVSLRALCTEILSIFSQSAIDKGLECSINVGETVPAALILDETRFRQIIVNLIGNAIKFTDKGSVTLKIDAVQTDTKFESQMELTVKVQDTGTGIPADKLESIFEDFVQARKTKAEKSGTGLGLAITRRLVEMMNGEISVESEFGKGSTFVVTLHGVKIAAADPANIQNTQLQKIKFEPATILIADDIDYNLEILSIFLENQNFRFLYAKNGEEAITQARDHQPDLILLDMKMPVMSGYEVSQKLKADDQLKTIPIIAVTASALKQDEEKISHMCDGYLRKPVSANDLIPELQRFLPYKIRQEDPPTTPKESAQKEKTATSIPQQSDICNARILLVDDNRVNIHLASTFLRKKQARVTVAHNGKEAFELVEREDFDLVLMDMHMPVMNGIDATRAIRKLDKDGIDTLTILAMSADDWHEIKHDCLGAGMNGHINKPIMPTELFSTVARYLM
ncbi:response regulator [Verrucomicrobiota bacterium]